MKFSIRKVLLLGALILVVLASLLGGAVADRLFGIKPLDYLFPNRQTVSSGSQRVVTEENAVIDVAEKVSPSVVTVSMETPERRVLQVNPFGGISSRIDGGTPQDIGSGFVVSADGLIVTNKHVVEATTAKYKVITKDNKEYEVNEIKRDPSNDLAILKITASNLTPVELGESNNLKVGQFVVAIGTALGQFRHTVTTGVISGLGRGISAGNPYEGYVEQLDDVIQTDAAINPGNSGGPLLNSSGQVIGINVAVAQGAQNIGFAIPVDIVKKGLDQFKETGSFASKAFLGVQYQMVAKESAILNNVPQGAYVVDVVSGSSADNAGVKKGDIITKFGGQSLDENNTLSNEIAKKNPGDKVSVEVWRDGETLRLDVTLSQSSG